MQIVNEENYFINRLMLLILFENKTYNHVQTISPYIGSVEHLQIMYARRGGNSNCVRCACMWSVLV